MSFKNISTALLLFSVFCFAFVGNSVGVRAEFNQRPVKLFMMFSAHHLAPYDDAYVENALHDLARTGVNAIVYTTLGELPEFWAKRKRLNLSELAYNRHIFQRAKDQKANVWLQMRVYGNRIRLTPTSPKRSLTAAQIIKPGPMQQAFLAKVRKDFTLYNRYFSNTCTVIAFEEAGIYHSAVGGGTFWSGRPKRIAKRSAAYDQMFAANLEKVFDLIKTTIAGINPKCQVGMHLGHSVFLNLPYLTKAINRLKIRGTAPDFIFYDFYLKAQRSYEKYRNKLADRKRYITDVLKLPVYHLAQLHTMNAFQHGKGRTPSKREINEMLALDRQLGFAGIGFYTKNARKTADFSNNPFAPNKFGQKTVYESSKDRWDYALLKLMETRHININNRFDIVLHGRFTNDAYTVSIKNYQTGRWDFLGYVNPLYKRRFREKSVIVFRSLRKNRYISKAGSASCARTTIRISPAKDFYNGFLQDLHIIGTERPPSYRTTRSIKFEIDSFGTPAKTLASLFPRARLDKENTTISLCQSR